MIGIAAAIIAGSFYAFGTVARSAYLDELGFDVHQFPPAGLELQVKGFASMAMVASPIGVFIVIFAGAVAGMKFAEKKTEARAQKRGPPTELRLVLVAIFCAAFMIAIFMAPGTSGERAAAVGVLLALPIVFVSPRLLVPTAGAMLLLLMGLMTINLVSNEAAEVARKNAEAWQKSEPRPIIDFDHKMPAPAPGVRIICSERFCGFHDGKTATVISLEGVRSIQSPMPPAPQPDARRGR